MLNKKSCQSCEGPLQPLTSIEIKGLLKQLSSSWLVEDGIKLVRSYTFKNFKDALAFTNRLGTLAEKENHHPDIGLKWGRVDVIIFTHTLNQLTENDFILAAKCDELLK